MDLSALANLNINPVFMGGTGLGSAMPSQSVADLRIDPATGLTLNIPRTVELDETGRVVREITPEGSMPGMYFSDDRGMPATTGLGDDARFTALDPNAVYTVVNERTGEVVTEGVGAEGLKAAQLASSQLSEAGRKADWAVVKTDPTTGATSAVANVDPRQSPLGKFADVVLPAALAFTPLGPVGGAALGSGVSSVAQGRSLGETLKRSAISGAAAGIGAGVGGKLGGALSKTAPSASGVGGTLGGSLAAAGPAAQAALNAALPGIVVPGALGSAIGSTLGTAAGAGLSGALSNMPAGRGADFADRVFEQPTTPAVQTPSPLDTATGGIDVVASRLPTVPPTPTPAGLASIPGAALLPSNVPQSGLDSVRAEAPEPEPEIIVRPTPAAPPTPAPTPTPGFVLDNGFWRAVSAPSPFSPLVPEPAPTPAPEPEPEIVVTRPTPVTPPTPTPTPAVNPGFVLDNGFWRAVSAPSPFAPAPAPAPEPEIIVRPTPAAPPPAAPPPNVVTGALPGLAAGVPAVIPEGVPTTPEEVARRQAEQEEGQIDVVRPRPTLPTGFDPGSIAPVLPNLVPSVAAPTPDVSPEIVVERDRAPTSFEEPPAVIPPVLPDFTNLPQPDVSVPEPEKSLGDKLKDRLSNLSATDYLRLAALGIGLVGGGGGGNRGALSTIPGGFGSGFAPVFGGGLPAPTLPGATGNFAPRTAADLRPQTAQDWYRYGYGPEQSFFDYVPEGEKNKSQAFTGYAFGGEVGDLTGDLTGGLGMSGNSYAVNGPGTGRSDEIPALLSDGEYVIDAETVALLGDGSSKAGAERLDQLRVKVRKDKGRKLAKGEFSVNAKRPEHYLKGGRV
jgi:hypothetical protein